MVDVPQESIRKRTGNHLSATGSLQRYKKSDSVVTSSHQLERSLTPPSRAELQSPGSIFKPESEAAYQRVLACLEDQVIGRSMHASHSSRQGNKTQNSKGTPQKTIDIGLLPIYSTGTTKSADQNVSQSVKAYTSRDTASHDDSTGIAKSIERDDRPTSKRRRK